MGLMDVHDKAATMVKYEFAIRLDTPSQVSASAQGPESPPCLHFVLLPTSIPSQSSMTGALCKHASRRPSLYKVRLV